jgi:Domain of unknown function (DUF222)/HNH endonuclease
MFALAASLVESRRRPEPTAQRRADPPSDPAGAPAWETPTELPTEHLEHEITQLAAHIYAATCRWLLLIAEFDRRECHLALGFHSCTAWLAWTCGLTRRAAREHVRVARDLVDLPLVRAAFGRGELSYSKVRALTRAAVPETEEEMLELAHNATAAQLERSVQAYRSAVAVAEGKPIDTFFAWSWEDDGTLEVRGRLAPDVGALLIEAMHHARGVACGPGGPAIPVDGEPVTPPVTNADALAVMAEASLASTGSSSGGDRHQVVLHIDGSGRRELDDGSTVSRETAQRFLCDASVVGIGEEAGEVRTVGRRTRTIPPALRRALRARDGGCRFPGCTHHRFVDAHHIRHWTDGGETSIENLVHLCRRHHRLIHEGGFTVERDGEGELVFRRPSGWVIHAKPPVLRGDAAAITSGARRPPRLASGDPLDLDLTVESMIGVSRRAARRAEAAAVP